MESKTLYDILEVEPTFTIEDIKKSYQRLRLLYHPDKKQSSRQIRSTAMDTTKQFLEIQHAWEILRDPATRKTYDESLLIEETPPLIHEFIDLDDMLYNANNQLFTYPCRCGDRYYLTEAELEQGYNIVCCETCSLAIKIMYNHEEEEEGGEEGGEEEEEAYI